MDKIRRIVEADIPVLAEFEREISEISFGDEAVTDLDFHAGKLRKGFAKDPGGMFVMTEERGGRIVDGENSGGRGACGESNGGRGGVGENSVGRGGVGENGDKRGVCGESNGGRGGVGENSVGRGGVGENGDKRGVTGENGGWHGVYGENGGVRIVGWLWMDGKENFLTGERYVNFRSFYVAEERRGREGEGSGSAARALMERGMEYCREIGAKSVVGKTRVSNLPMRALYKEFGFEAAHITMEYKF